MVCIGFLEYNETIYVNEVKERTFLFHNSFIWIREEETLHIIIIRIWDIELADCHKGAF